MRAYDMADHSLAGLGISSNRFPPPGHHWRVAILCERGATLSDLASYLEDHGAAVSNRTSVTELLSCMKAKDPALRPNFLILVAGAMMAGALSKLKRIRSRSEFFCMVVASDNDEDARIALLDAGCDDCVVMPTSPREIMARMRAILRRGAASRAQPKVAPLQAQSRLQSMGLRPEPLELGCGWKLCHTSREIYRPDGTGCAATTAEFDLLACLARRLGQPMSRDEISMAVYGRNCRIDDRSVDNLVVRLRRKLELNPREPKVLRSVRLIGYIFAGFRPPASKGQMQDFSRAPEAAQAHLITA